MNENDWYLKWFGEDYYRVYSHRDDSEAEAQVRLLNARLSLPPSPFVLDVACGRGRHVREWEKHGAHAVGIDRSAFALRDGKRSCEDCASTLILSDMRALPFASGSFDLITSMFTSFGYFETDDEHRELLQEWRRVLKTGGNLVIDYLNRDHAIRNLVPETHSEDDRYTMIQQRTLSADKKRLIKKILITRKACGSHKQFEESVRAYSPEELKKLLSQASLTLESMYGDFQGAPFQENSERCILLVSR